MKVTSKRANFHENPKDKRVLVRQGKSTEPSRKSNSRPEIIKRTSSKSRRLNGNLTPARRMPLDSMNADGSPGIDSPMKLAGSKDNARAAVRSTLLFSDQARQELNHTKSQSSSSQPVSPQSTKATLNSKAALSSIEKQLIPPPRRTINPVDVLPARSGDHPDIHHLLTSVFHGPSRDEYHAWQEKPGYDPAQRLLIRQGNKIASHVMLTNYTMRFGSTDLPVKQLHWLATLPEYRNQGHATALLQSAEKTMQNEGAVLGLLRTKNPHFFHRNGWAVCGRQSVSYGKARDILARLSAEPSGRRIPLSIRYWRHVELPSLIRIYRQNHANAYGLFQRTEEDWRWLLSRKAFDHIIVAIHGRDRMELEDTNAPLVGYAVMRGHRVVELLASPEYPSTAEQLLARACSEMIESDRLEIAVEAPPTCEVHRFTAESGGQNNHTESDQGEVLMTKLLDPEKLLQSMHGEFIARLAAADLPTTTEMGFSMNGTKMLLSITPRGIKWQSGKLGRSFLKLKPAEFTRLLLGHSTLHQVVDSDRVIPSTNNAYEIADALFPKLPWWRPSWDEITA